MNLILRLVTRIEHLAERLLGAALRALIGLLAWATRRGRFRRRRRKLEK